MGQDTLDNKRCPRCGVHKPTTEFYRSKRDGYQSHCKKCKDNAHRQRCEVNPHKQIFASKKNHAKRVGVEFTLRYEDVVWPEYCPVLGIQLDYKRFNSDRTGRRFHSPSFDRVNPNVGYTPENTIIVSARANTIKSNATVDELERVAAFYRQLISQEGSSHATETN